MVKNRKGLIVSWKPDLRSIEEKKHWLLNSAPSMDPAQGLCVVGEFLQDVVC